MFVVDGHEDIAVNALYAGRDVRRSVRETRERERIAGSPAKTIRRRCSLARR